MSSYKMKIAGLDRELKMFAVNDKLDIAAFILFGDVEVTVASATELLKKAPEFDVILTPEAKSIPLAYEMSRQSGKKYFICRKGAKLYMKEPVSVNVRSITTDKVQTLYLDAADAELMRGRRVVIVDDVISTGQSLHALEELVKMAGGNIVGRVAVLAEGSAIARDDIRYLAPLPLFDNTGKPI